MSGRAKKSVRPDRVNEKIKAGKVRLIDAGGKLVGVVDTKTALDLARKDGLDLVEVHNDHGQVTAKILDYSKYRYQKQLEAKKARKKQTGQAISEIKFRPNIAKHDYEFKVKNIGKFLKKGKKVKVTIVFKGREHEHRELGFGLIERIIHDLGDEAKVAKPPKLNGRNISMTLTQA